MKEAVELWEKIQAQDFDGLKETIQWNYKMGEKVSVVYREGKRFGLIASKRVRCDLLDYFVAGDPIEPAKTHLQRVINEGLHGRVSPRLLFESKERKKLQLYFVPKNLLGCLWLQCARMVNSDKQFHRCLMCQKFIKISLEKKRSRSDRKTCSDKCRQNLSRSKKGR